MKSSQASIAYPKPDGTVFHGKASYNEYTSRMRTAARGVRDGSVLKVWIKGKSPSSGILVTVNDGCGYPMKKMGRVLDLSTGAFKRLAGSLGKGEIKVCFKVIKLGKGQKRGKNWAPVYRG
jgi:hypothetical protein